MNAFRSLEDLGIQPDYSGKVRETIDLGDRLLMVTTDRLSAFDCVLPDPLPGKGVVLNRISSFWFQALAKHYPTHYLSVDPEDLPPGFRPIRQEIAGRFLLARKAERVPVECVVRGYLAGSGFLEYVEQGTLAGEPLPSGLKKYGRLPEPRFTPTTKEDEGHDLPLSRDELFDRVGEDLGAELESLSLDIYARADRFLRRRGLVVADTKFEFGWIDGQLSLIDEVLTPDSSRFWSLDSVERAARGKGAPECFDKQYVRDYLLTLDWNRMPPAPSLPEEVATEALRRYREVAARIVDSTPATGADLD